MRLGVAVAACVLAGLPAGCARANRTEVRVGSKAFTESVIAGELAASVVRSAGFRAAHRQQLGGTRILYNALLSGEIDVYLEYTGTITNEILPGAGNASEEQIRDALAERGVRMMRPLGFNNTYAIGMQEDVAARLGIRTISDLRDHQDLRLAFSNEFMDRADGWPGLRARYGLPQREVRGVDHDLAYRGLEGGTVEATDLYSTDAEIRYYRLRILHDDLGYFPNYLAVFLCRADLAERVPEAVAALSRLEGRVNREAMMEMNARVKLDKVPENRVAADWLLSALGINVVAAAESLPARLLRRTREHLALVSVSLLAAIVAGVPLGILAYRRPRLGPLILGAAGVIQTLPSLALLVFMIPLLGIGGPPALAALFLYSLLPIVRNTFTGLADIPSHVRESAEALGLPPGARLRLVELPIASRSILAGIKISAVINVGTATLGAIIGAGGYGQPILTGVRLDDVGLILEGAVPAALLALLVQTLFDQLERVVVPKGLRLRPER